MEPDMIVEEVRAASDEIARESDYDVVRIIRSLQNASAESGRQLVSFPPKRIEDDDARKAG